MPDALWDNFVLKQPDAHVLQLSAWGALKAAYGWQAERVTLGEGQEISAGAQILFKRFPGNVATMAYIPYGAYVTDESQWPELWSKVEETARQKRAAFLKWEPGINRSLPDIEQFGFRESPQTIQPPRTVLIDVTGSDDEIQSRMNQSTRRNIRKAYDNDIRYYQAEPQDVEKFTRIMDITGDRNEFGTHEAEYYQLAYELLVPHHATLILAEHEGDVLAGNFVVAAGNTACYLYGASSSKKRNLMASYGVQWEGIQWAQRRGCHFYDMWGIPDADKAALEDAFQERSDGLWGVYRFKRGWGGDIVRSAGTWDMVYNQILYAAYKTALKIAR